MMDEFSVRHIKQLKHLCDCLHKQEITLESFLDSQKQLVETIQHANHELWQDYCLELYDLEILLAAKMDFHFNENDLNFVRKITTKLAHFLDKMPHAQFKID